MNTATTISLTPAAAERAKVFLSSNPNAIGIRFGVKRNGCSGWGYLVDVADKIADQDRVFESEGIKIVVDGQHLPMVAGTQIDLTRQGLNTAFAFDNPQARAACGCGESFTTDDIQALTR
jgi:iron-sulfur cluster assembly protein